MEAASCYARIMLNSEKGQALLIVILVMVIGLTVGLSLASRSITNLRTTQEEVSSQQALSAAEAGIEQTLKSNVSIGNSPPLSNKATYTTSITQVLGTEFLLNGANPVLKDDGADLWLSDYSADPSNLYQNPWSGNINIYWGSSVNGCSNAALEVAIISGTKAAPKVTRYAFDPCLARSNNNHFTYVSGGGGVVSGKNFNFGTTVSISSGLIGRVIPLYQDSLIGVRGSVALPSQGSVVSSVGTAGDTKRKVTVFQGFPAIPAEYFPYGLFSP